MPGKIVYIHYGPYESCGVVDHRNIRLEGMQRFLNSRGHTTEVVPIHERDVVELWVKGELVYTCNIKELEFGGDGELDHICSEALQAVEKAF